MSFSQDIRSSGNFQELFGKQRRRINKSEVSKDDLSTLQHHVNNIRTQIDWAYLYDNVDNVNSNAIGPFSFIFEPDLTEVKAWNTFTSILGDGIRLSQTLNGTSYDAIDIGDANNATSSTKNCYYATPTGSLYQFINVGFHPSQLRQVNSIAINRFNESNSFFYYDNFGTDFDFTAQNFSMGFWFYPTNLVDTGQDRILAHYRVDANNKWVVAIDNSDNKLFMLVKNGGVSTVRQYDTAISTNTWYYFNNTWTAGTNTLSIKVNDNADTASGKTDPPTNSTISKLFFGSYPGITSGGDFIGYICLPHYYKHNTILTGTERTSLYNYGTRTNTTKPLWFGSGRFG